ncbi:MAG: pantetheine-phosphate adenylyltransferase [Bacteroidetes bacterium]|nr:pantetheine-phosphate adenylyltransferase [Bacteroidota bacterium]
MKIALYPGSFDPLTFGHIDIIDQSVKIFDKVIITVAINSSKKPMFNVEDRCKMIQEVIKINKYTNVEVKSFEGLVVNFAKQNNATALIRGMRAVTDFEYEFQMALMNKKLFPKISTVFLMPLEIHTYLTSTIVREIATHKGKIDDFVPPSVAKMIKKKLY